MTKETTIDDSIQLSAANKFKKLVTSRWESSLNPIPKKNYRPLSFILSSKWKIYVPLRQAFVFICQKFPLFPELNKTLKQALSMDNMECVHNILCFVNDLFKGFRLDSWHDNLLAYRDLCIEEFGGSFFKTVEQLSLYPFIRSLLTSPSYVVGSSTL
ncbi:hypothetical protein Tco_1419611 [Tanacetum coccineum]